MTEGKIPQLRLTSVKVLARKFHTTPAALARLCQNVESCDAHGRPIFYYHKEKIDKKGKKRPTDTPIGEFRVINDRINRLLQQVELPTYVKGGVRGESPRRINMRSATRRDIYGPTGRLFTCGRSGDAVPRPLGFSALGQRQDKGDKAT